MSNQGSGGDSGHYSQKGRGRGNTGQASSGRGGRGGNSGGGGGSHQIGNNHQLTGQQIGIAG